MPALSPEPWAADGPPGVRRFAVADLPAEPWRNGAGTTRTLAHDQRLGRTRWRVSFADLPQAAPFSRFPGLARRAVLLRGPGLVLQADARSWAFHEVGAAAEFDGDLPLQARPPAGGARLWNCMVDPATVRLQAAVRSGGCTALTLAGPSVLMVLAGRARLAVDGRPWGVLGPEQGLLTEVPLHGLSLQPDAGPLLWGHASFLSP